VSYGKFKFVRAYITMIERRYLTLGPASAHSTMRAILLNSIELKSARRIKIRQPWLQSVNVTSVLDCVMEL
jgi:hypothetical protein